MAHTPAVVFSHSQVAGASEDQASPILAAPEDSSLLVLSVGFYLSTFATADVYLNMVLLPPGSLAANTVSVALGDSKEGLYAVASGQASAGSSGVSGGNCLYPFSKWFATGAPLIIPPGWSLAIWFTNASPDANTYEFYAIGVPHAP